MTTQRIIYRVFEWQTHRQKINESLRSKHYFIWQSSRTLVLWQTSLCLYIIQESHCFRWSARRIFFSDNEVPDLHIELREVVYSVGPVVWRNSTDHNSHSVRSDIGLVVHQFGNEFTVRLEDSADYSDCHIVCPLNHLLHRRHIWNLQPEPLSVYGVHSVHNHLCYLCTLHGYYHTGGHTDGGDQPMSDRSLYQTLLLPEWLHLQLQQIPAESGRQLQPR